MSDPADLRTKYQAIGDLGAEAAADALASLLDAVVVAGPSAIHPEVPFDEIHQILMADSDAATAIAVIALAGELDGLVAIAIDDADAYLALFGVDEEEMREDIVGEVANICGAHFVGAAEDYVLGASDPTPPAVACSDMEMLLPSILALTGAHDRITLVTGELYTLEPEANTHIHFFPGPQTIARLESVST